MWCLLFRFRLEAEAPYTKGVCAHVHFSGRERPRLPPESLPAGRPPTRAGATHLHMAFDLFIALIVLCDSIFLHVSKVFINLNFHCIINTNI